MKIELLYFEECPHAEPTLDILNEVLKEERVAVDIARVAIDSVEQSVQQRFLGSPTLRIDGTDVEPDSARNSDYGLKCRVYQFRGRQYYCPPKEWVRQAIRQAQKL